MAGRDLMAEEAWKEVKQGLPPESFCASPHHLLSCPTPALTDASDYDQIWQVVRAAPGRARG